MTRSEPLGRLFVLLAGRTAEEIAFGDTSTGVQSDLQRATDLVRHRVASLREELAHSSVRNIPD